MSEIYFSKFNVTKQVFYKSKHTYAVVNLRPLVRGHVLVVPLRTNTPRLSDLSPEESIDYMQVLQVIHRFIMHVYKADSLNISIQDGPESGQSVPHLHTHILPRYKTDGHGDELYGKIEAIDFEKYAEEFQIRKSNFLASAAKFKDQIPEDSQRSNRTEEVMHKEAEWLAEELEKFLPTLNPNDVVIP
ncbi:bis(5'-adenosyl)-triphosphatase [[Candida] anglica]|uniref:Bis(5'-adenosyl)-triphosphatase n=1 Tax=[Candida] anglica TaxID=148631 RepID=A0ABP0EL60_9ASCO